MLNRIIGRSIVFKDLVVLLSILLLEYHKVGKFPTLFLLLVKWPVCLFILGDYWKALPGIEGWRLKGTAGGLVV